MSASYKRDILAPIDFSVEQTTVLYPYLREIFINEAPLVTRLPRVQAAGETYQILTYDVRQRTGLTLGAALADNTNTTVVVSDNTPLLTGDVLEVDSERVEVTAINSDGVTLTVRRGVEGTAGATHSNAAAVTLLYNSASGTEVDKQANRAIRSSVTQYVQTFQFPVQVGGKALAVQNIALPAGFADVFSGEQKVKVTEMMRDEEYACYYGKGEAPGSGNTRAKMKGLKTLIDSGNVTTSNAASYTKASFIADLFQKALDGGGNPDMVLCSTDFMTGLSTWSVGLQQFNNPQLTPYLGIPIKMFMVPFLGQPAVFVPSYQLKKGTAVALTSSDLKVRHLRQESWMGRGRRGDAYEGDWLCDIAIELDHPKWHAWREGITSYA